MAGHRDRLHWRRTQRLTALLLLVWLGANLFAPWFARDLDRVTLDRLPLGYWLAAQGLLLFYLLLIVVYVICMDRLDARHAQDPTARADE